MSRAPDRRRYLGGAILAAAAALVAGSADSRAAPPAGNGAANQAEIASAESRCGWRARSSPRARINCTMPGPEGRWRWLGMQFYMLP